MKLLMDNGGYFYHIVLDTSIVGHNSIYTSKKHHIQLWNHDEYGIFWLVVWLPFFIFPYIGLLIIPIDELIFFRGVALAHQPVFHYKPAILDTSMTSWKPANRGREIAGTGWAAPQVAQLSVLPRGAQRTQLADGASSNENCIYWSSLILIHSHFLYTYIYTILYIYLNIYIYIFIYR